MRVTESGKVRAKQHTCVWKYKVCNHHVGIKIYSGDVEGGGGVGQGGKWEQYAYIHSQLCAEVRCCSPAWLLTNTQL